jgi:signal transduction histidine kinase
VKNPRTVWSIFAAAVLAAAIVLAFLTVRTLQFEQSIARAEAAAALEETVRLALWRMDSSAALLLEQDRSKSPPAPAPTPQQAFSQQPAQLRNNPQTQNIISQQEFAQRQTLSNRADVNWQPLVPTLLERVTDLIPGATLEPAGPGESGDAAENDPRRLATIPARLVVPPAAMPATDLPWNTPLRLSLIIAWSCSIGVALAVWRLLDATLSLSQRRGAFASAVTHEMRTPLTTFRMYSEMLASGMISDAPRRQEYLTTLVTESDRLGRLIENVMAYSRLENRLSARHTQQLTVAELLEQSTPALQRRAAQAGMHLDTDLDPSLAQIPLRTDPVAVQQILINLVDNAAKYGIGSTPHSSGIRLAVTTCTAGIELAVSDNGPGIRGDAARLFAPFSKRKDDPIPGIGLGLYISRQLARDLGGDLQHRPTASGTTFVLTLPR